MSERYKDAEWLEREYVHKGRSTTDISQEFDITHSTISHYLHKHGISTGEYSKFRYICPHCNIPQRDPSMHFSGSSCRRPDISDVQEKMLKGLVMGDGSIAINSKNWAIRWGSTNREFMKWFNWRMGDLGICVREDNSDFETRIENINRIRNNEKQYSKCSKIYWWNSISHPKINNIFSSWVNNGVKDFGEEVNLNPVNVCIWYCGDGGLAWSNKSSTSAKIVTVNESDNIEKIRDSFNGVGFNPSIHKEERENCGGEHIYSKISFSVKETEELLEWMGGPPPGMEYKWETDSYERYQELMDSSKTTMQKENKDSIFDY